jgi:hypothetical protein
MLTRHHHKETTTMTTITPKTWADVPTEVTHEGEEPKVVIVRKNVLSSHVREVRLDAIPALITDLLVHSLIDEVTITWANHGGTSTYKLVK